MSNPINQYLKSIQHALQAGNATEHTHRPALKTLVEALAPGITAVNEPKHIACGAPDYAVTRAGLTVGYIEAKDVGKPLSVVERSGQLRRYRKSLENLVLTDYLEFRWYVDGACLQTASLAQLNPGGQLTPSRKGRQAVQELLRGFLEHAPQPVRTPRNLAVRMARLAHMVRDIIIEAYEQGQASPMVQGWRQAFARVLIADLDQPGKTADFADMFAQTLAYGLFSARAMDPTPSDFSRQEAQRLIPKSNPFLRDFFYQITGPKLDDEPFASFVDDLVALLRHTDMQAVLAEFGRRTTQEDPVVHFYETFLAAYDPGLRRARGVSYTPAPIVSYIVRSLDYLLRTYFDCPDGLADNSQIVVPNYDVRLKVKGKHSTRKTTMSHKVLILDPACGTGTFLYAVVDHIRQQFITKGNAGMWPGYVKNHLLPRLFGFEILMAPYAVAHFKLSLQLAGRDLPESLRALWGCEVSDGERIGVYLTNTLEAAHEWTGLPLFPQGLAEETKAANKVKRHRPIMLVLGNPPYSVSSANKGPHIDELMEPYKAAVRGERNIQPLSDDYIKFIRFAHDRIERTGQGIVAMITNHAYLSGLIHRGMREELLKSFSQVYVLNLHGSAIRGDKAPDGRKDENVFDIRPGVAIALFVKEGPGEGLACTKYAELWGSREEKYDYLAENDVSSTDWQLLRPAPPYSFFVPKEFDRATEYRRGWSVADVLSVHSSGIKTHRDRFAVDFDETALRSRIMDLRNARLTDEEVRQRYRLRDTRDWKLSEARARLQRRENWEEDFATCLYRPFDVRPIYYSSDVVELPRFGVMRHLLHRNVALLTMRGIRTEGYAHFFVSKHVVCKDAVSGTDACYVFPLYLYCTSEDSAGTLFMVGEPTRQPNLSEQLIATLERELDLRFQLDGRGDLRTTIGPEDILHYAYAVLHSPTYRERYAEFLKIDFARLPLTSDLTLFRTLAQKGEELVGLHLMELPKLNQLITKFPVVGSNEVEKVRYREPHGDVAGRVYINKTQYFEGVNSAVWEFRIGGYQVLDKWLKDRKGRALSFEDLLHYQKVVVALSETIVLMKEIDQLIPEWPID